MIIPQNYEEVVRLKKCMEMCKFIKDSDERTVEMLYAHLMKPGSYIMLTREPTGIGKLSMYIRGTDTETTSAVEIANNVLIVTLNATSIQTTYPQDLHSRGGGGGTYGNNNNNNNNNNA